MIRDTDRLIADSMGVTPEMLPLIPLLLEDLQVLGGWSQRIVKILGEYAQLPNRAGVVDLGCGKGAASIAVAKEFGCQVTGVDLFAPFLKEAEKRAEAEEVAELCTFQLGDLRDVVQRVADFDVAIFAAVGAGLFGGYAESVAAIRECVRTGGYLVISDGFLKQPLPKSFPGYEFYDVQSQVLNQLTSCEDFLIHEELISRKELIQQNRSDFSRMRSAAERLLATHPEQRENILEFLAHQAAEYEFINDSTVEAIWLLRRCH